MVKITSLAPAGPVTGGETVPIVQDGETRRVPLADLFAPVDAAVAAAQAAADQAADLVLPANIFVDVALATAEAAVATGATFKVVSSASGLAEVRKRTIGGSELLYTEPTRSYLASSAGAEAIGAEDGAVGSLWTTIQGFIAYLRSSAGASIVKLAGGRTLQAKADDVVNLKDEGAVAGGASIHTVLGAALDKLAARGGGILEIPPGNYNMTAAVTREFADDVYIEIRGHGAKINGSGVASSLPLIALRGKRVSNTTLSANIAKGDTTFGVASASGLAKGKILLITSTDLFNPTRHYYYKGELVLVEKLTGTTVTNSNQAYDNYSSASTTVHILDMPRIVVKGLEIVCDADVIGLEVLYSRNPLVEEVKVNGARYAGIYVGYYLGGLVNGCAVRDIWNGLVTGTSYGISIGSGQGMKVTNNDGFNCRHFIASGGFEPNRDMVIDSNVGRNSTLEDVVGSIDMHGNVSGAVISNNVTDSITCSGINVEFASNRCSSAESGVPGITIFQEIDSDYYTFTGGRTETVGASSYGVWVCPTQPNLTIGELKFNGFSASSVANALRIQPRTSSATGCKIRLLTLIGGTFKSVSQVATVLSSNGAASISISEIKSVGNTFDASAHDSFAVIGTPIASHDSVGDTYRANRSGNSVAQFGGTDIRLTSPRFIGNTGGAGNSYSVRYAQTGKISVLNPVYAGVNNKAEIVAATEYLENGWSGATPGIVNAAGAKILWGYSPYGTEIAFGTAPPTTGTWATGARMINRNTSVGQPKAWVAAPGGTPGTWVSEGNL